MNAPPGSRRPSPETYGRVRWAGRILVRNAQWARTQGVRELVEEHELHPVRRTIAAVRKARWRRAHSVSPGQAVAVFLAGMPRSGTNMLVRALAVSPELEAYNDGNAAAFHRHRLRPDPAIRDLVMRSRYNFVLFKPLLDAHRVVALLDELGTPRAPKAVWIYRDVDGRARSALEKFGAAALIALRDVAAGEGLDRWQAQGLSEDSLGLIRDIDLGRVAAADGAALLWYVQNRIFFERGLEHRADVLPLSYDALVRAPETTMREVCAFLGVGWEPGIAADIDTRSIAKRPPLLLDPRIRELCDGLAARLDAAAASVDGMQWRSSDRCAPQT
jgi:hypothetical protein